MKSVYGVASIGKAAAAGDNEISGSVISNNEINGGVAAACCQRKLSANINGVSLIEKRQRGENGNNGGVIEISKAAKKISAAAAMLAKMAASAST